MIYFQIFTTFGYKNLKNSDFYGLFEDKSQDVQTDSADTHTKETER